MSVIRMTREHQLPLSDAKQSAEAIVVNLAEEFGVKYHWEDDTVKFKGAGAKGYLTVMSEKVDMKMELGFLLMPFRARIEKEMIKYLDDFVQGIDPTN